MEFDTRAQEPPCQDKESGGLFSIPDLVNIMYRGRKLTVIITALGLVAGLAYSFLTKPLYLATAQIRPGIVSYTPDGGPVREWALKDITKWFEESLYWADMRSDPKFDALTGPPVILAEFIPSSLVTAGGDVITLNTLSPDSALAGDILEAAIRSFNVQARLDSLGSSLYLTLKGGEIRMARLRDDIDQVAALEQRSSLEIEKQKREMDLLELKKQELDLDRGILESDNAWRRKAIETTVAEVASAERRLAQAETLMEVALEAEVAAAGTAPAFGSGDPRLDLLLQTAGREQAGRVGELLLTINQLSEVIHDGRIMADSLQARIQTNELGITRLALYRDIRVEKQMGDIQQKISDLQLQLDKDLPHSRAILKSDLEAERIKMNLVSPLQHLGRITVTDKPVRPRKLLATAILTMLAFFGSLVLVFILEYYQKNRAAITRRSGA